jgi:hypothetical protein
MPKQRPPFDYERYASLKAQGLSQRQIAREMGMPEATLRNNMKVYQGSPTGVPTTSTEVDQGTPRPQDDARSTQVSHSPPTSAPDVSQVSLRPPRDTSPVSTQVDLGTPLPASPRSTQVSPGGLTEEMAHDLQALVAWWRQRSEGSGHLRVKIYSKPKAHVMPSHTAKTW